jgi:hypothetical protein
VGPANDAGGGGSATLTSNASHASRVGAVMREVGDGGGRLLTSSEDDGSIDSLSGYDFNDDGL